MHKSKYGASYLFGPAFIAAGFYCGAATLFTIALVDLSVAMPWNLCWLGFCCYLTANLVESLTPITTVIRRFVHGDIDRKLTSEILVRIGQWSRAAWLANDSGATLHGRLYSPLALYAMLMVPVIVVGVELTRYGLRHWATVLAVCLLTITGTHFALKILSGTDRFSGVVFFSYFLSARIWQTSGESLSWQEVLFGTAFLSISVLVGRLLINFLVPKQFVGRRFHTAYLRWEVWCPIRILPIRYVGRAVAVVSSVRVKSFEPGMQNNLWQSVVGVFIRRSRYVIADADGLSEGCGLAWELEQCYQHDRRVLVLCRSADYTAVVNALRAIAPEGLLLPADFRDRQCFDEWLPGNRRGWFHIFEYDDNDDLQKRSFAFLEAFYRYDLLDWWDLYQGHRRDPPATLAWAFRHFLFSSASFRVTIDRLRSVWLKTAYWS